MRPPVFQPDDLVSACLQVYIEPDEFEIEGTFRFDRKQDIRWSDLHQAQQALRLGKDADECWECSPKAAAIFNAIVHLAAGEWDQAIAAIQAAKEAE